MAVEADVVPGVGEGHGGGGLLGDEAGGGGAGHGGDVDGDLLPGVELGGDGAGAAAVAPDGQAGAAVLLADDLHLPPGGAGGAGGGAGGGGGRGEVGEAGGGRLDGPDDGLGLLQDDLGLDVEGDGRGGGGEVGVVGEGGRGQDEALGAGLEAPLGGGAVLHLAQLAEGVDVTVLALDLAGGEPGKCDDEFLFFSEFQI